MVFMSPETAPESDWKPAFMSSTVSSKSLLRNPDLPLPPLNWTVTKSTTAPKNSETSATSPSQQSSPKHKLAKHGSPAGKKTDPIPAAAVIAGPEAQKPKHAAPEKKSKLCIRLRTKEKALVEPTKEKATPVVPVEPTREKAAAVAVEPTGEKAAVEAVEPTKEKAAVVGETQPEPENNENEESSVADLAAAAAAEEEEAVQKTWNLRPRRPVTKANGRTGALKTGAPLAEQNKTTTQEAGGGLKAGAKGVKKDNKLKISVSLTKDEIEEDIFLMTGARLSRRSKKRAKNVQKQLDHLYPGSFLNTVATDSYEVPEVPFKIEHTANKELT